MDGRDVAIRRYSAIDEADVIALWQRCDLIVPSNDPEQDIARKMQFQPDLFLVATCGGRIVGTVMVGYEGHRGWINYLAVDPALQRGGLGRQLMAAAEERLRALGCLKVNLQVRSSNRAVVEFYERLGFAVEDRVSMGKRLS